MLLMVGLISCSPGNDEAVIPPSSDRVVVDTPSDEVQPTLDFSDVAQAFQQLAQERAGEMLNHCNQMQIEIQAFLATPSASQQALAQSSYRRCYQHWIGLSLFFQQPFDLADTVTFTKLVDLIDTRPFLPGYIDGLPDYPFSGLVHELDIPINQTTLRGQHRLMDEDSASVGFPVLEFFLWKTPLTENWQLTGSESEQVTNQRRRDYLNVASELLNEHLAEAARRWQSASPFMQLPERAQLAFVLSSLQRLVMIELLSGQFSEAILMEPEWYHPALISGQGRAYSLLRLITVRALVEVDDSAFSQWLAEDLAVPVPLAALQQTLVQAIGAIEALPENYPFATTPEEEWQEARRQLAQLALLFSELAEYHQLALITE